MHTCNVQPNPVACGLSYPRTEARERGNPQRRVPGGTPIDNEEDDMATRKVPGKRPNPETSTPEATGITPEIAIASGLIVAAEELGQAIRDAKNVRTEGCECPGVTLSCNGKDVELASRQTIENLGDKDYPGGKTGTEIMKDLAERVQEAAVQKVRDDLDRQVDLVKCLNRTCVKVVSEPTIRIEGEPKVRVSGRSPVVTCYRANATAVGTIIDEAVELAKRYSTEQSGRFVNGVLAELARRERPGEMTGAAGVGG